MAMVCIVFGFLDQALAMLNMATENLKAILLSSGIPQGCNFLFLLVIDVISSLISNYHWPLFTIEIKIFKTRATDGAKPYDLTWMVLLIGVKERVLIQPN